MAVNIHHRTVAALCNRAPGGPHQAAVHRPDATQGHPGVLHSNIFVYQGQKGLWVYSGDKYGRGIEEDPFVVFGVKECRGGESKGCLKGEEQEEGYLKGERGEKGAGGGEKRGEKGGGGVLSFISQQRCVDLHV